jgi:hypothetical protein
MINQNFEKKQKITFRENSEEIIDEILKKYGLEEGEQEIEKIIGGEVTYGGKIAEIVWRVSIGEISLKDLALIIESELNIPLYKAERIANELREKVFIFEETAPQKEISERLESLEKKEISEEIQKEKFYHEADEEKEIPKKFSKIDPYREPIE